MLRADALPPVSSRPADAFVWSRMLSRSYGFALLLTGNYLTYIFGLVWFYRSWPGNDQQTPLGVFSLITSGVCVGFCWYIARQHSADINTARASFGRLRHRLTARENERLALEQALEGFARQASAFLNNESLGEMHLTGPLEPMASSMKALLARLQALEVICQSLEEQQRVARRVLLAWDRGWVIHLAPGEHATLLLQFTRSQQLLSRHFRQLRQAVEGWRRTWEKSHQLLEGSRQSLKALQGEQTGEEGSDLTASRQAWLLMIEEILSHLEASYQACQPDLKRAWDLSNTFREEAPTSLDYVTMTTFKLLSGGFDRG